jgi:hypothetical protein
VDIAAGHQDRGAHVAVRARTRPPVCRPESRYSWIGSGVTRVPAKSVNGLTTSPTRPRMAKALGVVVLTPAAAYARSYERTPS